VFSIMETREVPDGLLKRGQGGKGYFYKSEYEKMINKGIEGHVKKKRRKRNQPEKTMRRDIRL